MWDGTSAPSADDPNKDVIVSIIAAENERVANENARISAENARKTAETARIDAENTRIANESVRVSNEAERVSAESVRKTEFATWQGEIGKISAFDKRIENLEAAVSPGLVTPTVDDSVAYIKNVPTGALPNAMISEVGGMTRKCMNLIPYPYSETSKTTNGITFTINADGSIIVNGTATADARIFLKAYSYTDNIKLVKGETYTLSGYPVTGIGLGVIQIQDILYSEDYVNEGYAKTFTAQHESYYMVVKILEGKTVSNLTIRPMLNRGDTALPYEPYFEGLRDAKVTAIESVGINIFGGIALGKKIKEIASGAVLNEQDKTIEYPASEISGGIIFDDFEPNTQYTFIFRAEGTEGHCNLSILYTDNTLRVFPKLLASNTVEDIRIVTDGSKSVARFMGEWSSGATTLYYEHCGIFKGNVTLDDFSPYVKNTFEIPEAVQALEGYGQGVSKEYHNKIVLDPAEGVKKFVKKTARTNFGKITLTKMGDVTYYGAWCNIGMRDGNDKKAVSNIPFTTNYQYYSNYNGEIIGAMSEGTLYIKNPDFPNMTDEEITEYLKSVELVYELATPIETDISDYFGEDNLIGVEGGGTVTMVNEYEYDVPSVIEYTVKGSDAT